MQKSFIGMFAMLLAACAVAGCGAGPTAGAREDKSEPATVRFVQIETGCWVLETQAGRVQPIDLPEPYRVDGLAVSVELRDAPAMMSACQVGPLKTIVAINKR